MAHFKGMKIIYYDEDENEHAFELPSIELHDGESLELTHKRTINTKTWQTEKIELLEANVKKPIVITNGGVGLIL